MVYRFQLTYDEIIDILDLKHIPTKRTGYSLNLGIYEVVDLYKTLKDILPNNVKVSVTIDDVRLKSNLKNNETLLFTEKSFIYKILCFTRSRSYPLDEIDGFYQLIAVSEENNKFELDTDTFDEFSFSEFKDEVEEIFNVSDITPYHLQHEIIGPRIIETYWKLRSEKSNTDGFIILLGYAKSPFRDFESYLRFVVGSNEDDIQLILKQ